MYPDLQELGVEVVAVSVDSQFVHKMWDEHELSKMVDGGVPFPMISDAAGHLGKAYGVYDDEAGVDRFIMNVNFGVEQNEVLESIQCFAEEVMPHFATDSSPQAKAS